MTTINLIAGAVLGLASTLATAAEWEDVKSPTELRALYSNKTFKGKDYLDRPWVGHYRADGKGIMISEAGRIPRTWAVMGNDQVCVNTPFNTLCFRFQRHASTPGTYRSINVANDMTTVFVVEDGVPEF